ncbi:hypothetical protein DFH09DRAFT_1109706 [Mycena vulgaris]|nr:hypothetical protein DFH09DRAFT_1109706 [Mycena vulgaris]
MADDQEDEVSHPSTSPPPHPFTSPPPDDGIAKKRRIVDFDPDEDGWEDEDAQLAGLGTTTHRSRHRTVRVIPICKHRRRVGGANSHATAKARAIKTGKGLDLVEDLAAWEVEREECAQQLADKHCMKLKEMRQRMLSTYVANAAYKLAEVKVMVAMDLSMLERRRRRQRSWWRWRSSARRDPGERAPTTLRPITGLAEHAGMVGFAFFMRGHIHDKTVPITIQLWGALDFFHEILKKDLADVSALFELWAVSRERGDTGADTLLAMQKECTNIITSGLRTVLARTKVKMNFENYIKSLVEGKNIGLVGWPEGVKFKRMPKQSKIGPLHILRDALKCGTVKWKVLTPGEKKQLVEQYKDMVRKGEATEKAGKAKAPQKSSDDEEEDEDDPPCAKAKAMPKTSSRAASPKEVAPRKNISEMTVEEKRAWLVGLVEKAKRKAGGNKGNNGSTPRVASKCCRDEEGEGARKKRRKERVGEAGEDSAGGKTVAKQKRGMGEDEEEGSQRRKKKKEGDNPQHAAKKNTPDVQSTPTPTVPRPKSRPKPRLGATTTTITPETSTTTSSTSTAPATTDAPPDSTGSTSSEAPATTIDAPPNGAGELPPSPTDAPPNGSGRAPSAASGRRNTVKGKAGGPPGVR